MNISSLPSLTLQAKKRLREELEERGIDVAKCRAKIGRVVHVYYGEDAEYTEGHVVLFLSGRMICWIKPQR